MKLGELYEDRLRTINKYSSFIAKNAEDNGLFVTHYPLTDMIDDNNYALVKVRVDDGILEIRVYHDHTDFNGHKYHNVNNLIKDLRIYYS